MTRDAEAVRVFISSLEVGECRAHGALAVFPLFGKNAAAGECLTLQEALQEGVFNVTEIGAGTVPTILVTNRGNRDVFIMDGQQLVGARQNRTVNISILVPGESELKIPVSCVEQGRWHSVSRDFSARGGMSFAHLRRTVKSSVINSLAAGDGPRSDQGAVWNEIGRKGAAHRVASPTRAMEDIYRQEEGRLADYEKALRPVPGQVGAVFALEGTVFGLDIFCREALAAKLLPGIIRSYALDALGRPAPDRRPAAGAARSFLEALAGGNFSEAASPGEGVTVSIAGRGAEGTALYARETVMHLSGYTNKAGGRRAKPATNFGAGITPVININTPGPGSDRAPEGHGTPGPGRGHSETGRRKVLDELTLIHVMNPYDGMQGVTELDENVGLLFRPAPVPEGCQVVFTGHDCLLVLGMVALDSDGRILKMDDMAPETTIDFPRETAWVIETNPGWFPARGFRVGDVIPPARLMSRVDPDRSVSDLPRRGPR